MEMEIPDPGLKLLGHSRDYFQNVNHNCISFVLNQSLLVHSRLELNSKGHPQYWDILLTCAWSSIVCVE